MQHGRKIAITGTCPSSKMQVLQLPDDWEVWACSPGNTDLPRVDVWFELHGDIDFPSERGIWEPYIAWMNLQTFPVYMQDQHLVPRAMPFPYRDLVREFGCYFFTSQPAWMLAYALHVGAREIGLFGLDMAARSEYGHQKAAVLHFAVLAAQRGVKVFAPPESEVLMPPPLYGYSFNSPMGRKLRVRQAEVQAEVNKMERQAADLASRLQHFRGVLDENDWTQQTWTGGLPIDDGAEVINLQRHPPRAAPVKHAVEAGE